MQLLFRIFTHCFLLGLTCLFTGFITLIGFGSIRQGIWAGIVIYVVGWIGTRRREPLHEETGWLDWRTKEPEDYMD